MSALHSLYSVFAPERVGFLRLLVVNVATMAGTMLGVVLVRRFVFGSYSLGADVLTSFLLGLALVSIFNSLVYFGVFGHPQAKQ